MAFEALKQRQSVMWGNGPYQRVTETIADIHELIVARLSPKVANAGLILRAALAPCLSARRALVLT
jgi:hypothetical protein